MKCDMSQVLGFNSSINIVKKELNEITRDDLGKYGCFINEAPLLEPPAGEDDLWTVKNEIKYIAVDGTLVVIKDGDKTDLASTTRIGKAIFGGPGRETAGAVIHDEGYEYPLMERWNVFSQEWWKPGRDWWDGRFDDLMAMYSTPPIRKCVYYKMVRMFGWIMWHRNGGK